MTTTTLLVRKLRPKNIDLFSQDTQLINRKICAFDPRICAFPLISYSTPSLKWLVSKMIVLVTSVLNMSPKAY